MFIGGRTSTFLSGPRSGPNENSPALQRWDRDRMTPKSAKRTAEKINKIDRFIQSSANADLSQCLGSPPSAEALGYSQPSASPTFEAKPSVPTLKTESLRTVAQ